MRRDAVASGPRRRSRQRVSEKTLALSIWFNRHSRVRRAPSNGMMLAVVRGPDQEEE